MAAVASAIRVAVSYAMSAWSGSRTPRGRTMTGQCALAATRREGAAEQDGPDGPVAARPADEQVERLRRGDQLLHGILEERVARGRHVAAQLFHHGACRALDAHPMLGPRLRRSPSRA